MSGGAEEPESKRREGLKDTDGEQCLNTVANLLQRHCQNAPSCNFIWMLLASLTQRSVCDRRRKKELGVLAKPDYEETLEVKERAAI